MIVIESSRFSIKLLRSKRFIENTSNLANNTHKKAAAMQQPNNLLQKLLKFLTLDLNVE